MNRKDIKVIATIGPASHSSGMITELARAGVDIFRINLSHAKPQEVKERVKWIRDAAAKLNKSLMVLGDLPGPKIRIGDMLPNTILEQGHKFVISKSLKVGDKFGCGINHPSVLENLLPGAEVFIDDGTIKLEVVKKTEDETETKVIVGGHLKSKKGFLAVGLSFNTTEVSEIDKAGIKLLIEQKADLIAVSFVETEKDMQDVRNLLPNGSNIKLIAKVETVNGVKNAEKILDESDELMIARGDLGLTVPIAQLPHIQKELVALCNRKGKPVIVATQMLESMTVKPVPTRAEVCDVANAVLDGTTAVMLSAETATGKFPVETVEMIQGIINEAVKHVKPMSRNS